MDLDGVVYRGSAVIPGAVKFVKWLQDSGQRYLFLTNHSARTPNSFADKLLGMGIAARPEHFLSSAMVTAEFLQRERPGKRVFAIGEEGLCEALKSAGVEIVTDRPHIVVVGFDRGFRYDTLLHATRFILQGAEFIGTNTDNLYPIEDGPAPECGPLLAAVENATGRKPLVMGKPERFMFEEALRLLGSEPGETMMVGDRLDTDIAGAKAMGMQTILVLSGATTSDQAAGASIQPDHIRADLGACIEKQ